MIKYDKRALITGINGFTGHYMAAELSAAGYQIFGMGSFPNPDENYYQADLTDFDSVVNAIEQIKPDVVIHLAAIAFVGHGDPNAFYQVNLTGTRNLLQALAQSTHLPEVVLLASSANVYGNTIAGQLDEQIRPNPANDYAVSKLAMEYMANLWHEKLPIIIARPFNYTGVGQAENFLLPKIVKHFKEKAASIELGNLEVWRDFTDVRSLVNAYSRLVQSPKAIGKTINVCSEVTYSLQQIVDICQELSSHSLEIKVNPAFVRANDVKTLSGDATLLKGIIGPWEPILMKDTLRWMLQN
ncbi:GDP-mannose 4,6-dehydratase [Hafnia psychrotolerans]|jgi:nucleoside-diphosphate-sugar epimerase|uniref:GDP-6-deoxy-D-lyxo-4-hexulose reductase n=1 Tax=Hafnia psychrotolerans TaxID=1477018 RepID=A0ABQ1G201_9GAMM|nr:GDP-mannose 4,6-dehydratase [Hafnia psychrotolerans]GGA34797.1 GDP-6-deoxy-D-lyxo-4-hexulose reductase [Hafnia psychrotolerans]